MPEFIQKLIWVIPNFRFLGMIKPNACWNSFFSSSCTKSKKHILLWKTLFGSFKGRWMSLNTGLPIYRSFFDDVIAYGFINEEHDAQPPANLNCYESNRLLAFFEKCQFFKTTTDWPGLKLAKNVHFWKQDFGKKNCKFLTTNQSLATSRGLFIKIAIFFRVLLDNCCRLVELTI